jgi:hypothetical protein
MPAGHCHSEVGVPRSWPPALAPGAGRRIGFGNGAACRAGASQEGPPVRRCSAPHDQIRRSAHRHPCGRETRGGAFLNMNVAADMGLADRSQADRSKIPQSAHKTLRIGLVRRGASFGMTIVGARRLSSHRVGAARGGIRMTLSQISASAAPRMRDQMQAVTNLFNLPQGSLGEVRAWASGGGAAGPATFAESIDHQSLRATFLTGSWRGRRGPPPRLRRPPVPIILRDTLPGSRIRQIPSTRIRP